MKQYTDQLETLLEEHDAALNALGDKIRSEVVEPFCRKHGFTYTSGMGMFFFTDTNGVNYSPAYNMPKGKVGREMQEIFNLLNTDFAYNQCLGYLVGDVR